MESKNRMILSLIVGIVIFMVSLFVASVSFSILGSSAQATLQEWKIGGAFAAFILAASVLASMVMQLNRILTKSEAEELQNQLADQKEKSNHLIMELQNKLIRGAPTPDGFTIDVDERHKLVFARPIGWMPKDNLLYAYIKKINKGFASNFNVIYNNKDDLELIYEEMNWGNFDASNPNIEDLYSKMAKLSIENLKIMVSNTPDPSVFDEYIFIDNFKSLKCNIKHEINGAKLHFIAAFIYVPRMEALYNFTFTDSEEKFIASSEIFNNIINSIRFLP